MEAVYAERLALIGDVGGHRQVLDYTLRGLGADLERFVLPGDLVVVQVGDLVGGAEQDAGIVADVDMWMERNPGRWFQLVGNWEARHLGGPMFTSPRRDRVDLSGDARATLGRWVDDGLAGVALAIRSARGGEALVTHGGLCRGFWEQALASIPSAQECAWRLNRGLCARPEVVFRPGRMLGHFGGGPPGPVWASAAEVWGSWAVGPQPFHQVHGHTNPYFFRRQEWAPDMPERIRATARVEVERRHTWWADRRGHRVVSIDPSLGSRPLVWDLHPLVLRAASILPNEQPTPVSAAG